MTTEAVTTDDTVTPGACAHCDTPIVDAAETFCGHGCTQSHVGEMLAALTKLQAKGAPKETESVLVPIGVLVPPGWVKAQRWFYFVDARHPGVACFGTLEDAQRCADDGGWPRPISTEEGRASEHRRDAITLWPMRRARSDGDAKA